MEAEKDGAAPSTGGAAPSSSPTSSVVPSLADGFQKMGIVPVQQQQQQAEKNRARSASTSHKRKHKRGKKKDGKNPGTFPASLQGKKMSREEFILFLKQNLGVSSDG